MTAQTLQEALARSPASGATRRIGGIPDDAAMLRAAVELSRDISTPRALIYWSDLLASALIGYGAAAVMLVASQPPIVIGAALVAILALYRAGAFIHELTHVRDGALPGFRLGWNLVVGIPLLVPSFLYEGVHTLHHARTRYGTADDPEYLPLAHMKPWSLPLFVLVAALAPLGALLRFGVLTPLGLVVPGLRARIVARYSALSINPDFRRRAPAGTLKRQWFWQEAGASLWAIALIASPLLIGPKLLASYAVVLSGIAVINQLRTLVAHLWENDGGAISVTAQYLDSVNVPPPALLAPLWAPVGLRYHALHHLLPSMPYHALGEAHRRLSAALGTDSPYARANHGGLAGLVMRLARSTMRAG
jgi:fatty acid desaturase